ncbi:MAG: FecR domain-containing protein [Bacteroidales bacterium]|nr:FecR domain-containing protein [Bacteroidales bacterium]
MDTRTLQKYIEGDLSREETRKVYEWISQSEENKAEYRDMRRLYEWMVLNDLPARQEQRRRSLRGSLGYLMACAASLALFVLGSLLYQKTRPGLPDRLSVETLTAPAGKTLDVHLADGSDITLNAGSTLRILPSSRNARREVYLDGEGYFKVARDEKRPFLVHTGEWAVKVLGTEFNVRSYDRDARWEVSLASGAISILDAQEHELTTLIPGTMVSLREGRLVKSEANSNAYLWKDGIFSFENLTLREILDRLTDYYGIRFDTAGCHILEHRYTGKFRANDGYEHILKVLQIGHRFRYDFQEEPEGILIVVKS